MAEVDFSDFESVEEWFQTQSTEVRCAISSRAALRVLANSAVIPEQSFEYITLVALRAILTAACRSIESQQDIDWTMLSRTAIFGPAAIRTLLDEEGRHATEHLSAAALAALAGAASPSSANCATGSVIAAHSAASRIGGGYYFASLAAVKIDSSSIEYDDKMIASVEKLLSRPVWDGVMVSGLNRSRHDDLLSILNSNPKWSFWSDWYERMWEGTFESWGLAHEVIQISDTFWQGNDPVQKVAYEIEKLKNEFLFKNSPQVEDIFETSDGLYDVRSSIVDLSTLIDSVLKRIKFSYDMAIQSNHCDLSSMNVAAQAIQHVLENCRDDPNALEQYLRNARSLIQRGIDDNQLAVSDELTMLIATLDETTLQLRTDHPEIAAAVQARTKQRLREIDDSKRIAIASNMDAMRDVTALRLNEEYQLDAAITRDGSDADAMSEAIQRSGHRAGKINLAEQAKKAEGSGVMSGLKISLRAKTLYDAALELMAGLPM
jgi:hypothetical protein